MKETTGLFLHCKKDNEISEGQIAITEMCTLPNPEFKNIYFKTETREFYLKD
jgi:hypothetical protein